MNLPIAPVSIPMPRPYQVYSTKELFEGLLASKPDNTVPDLKAGPCSSTFVMYLSGDGGTAIAWDRLLNGGLVRTRLYSWHHDDDPPSANQLAREVDHIQKMETVSAVMTS